MDTSEVTIKTRVVGQRKSFLPPDDDGAGAKLCVSDPAQIYNDLEHFHRIRDDLSPVLAYHPTTNSLSTHSLPPSLVSVLVSALLLYINLGSLHLFGIRWRKDETQTQIQHYPEAEPGYSYSQYRTFSDSMGGLINRDAPTTGPLS